MDNGLAETQFIEKQMEYRIKQHYGQAQKELEEKVKKYYKDFVRLDEKKLQEVNEGKLSMDDYKKWRQAKVMSGKVWEQRKEAIATDLHNANDIAQSMIYGYLPEVYAANHNFATYQIEQKAEIDTSYVLYNREAVEKLIAEQPDLIPYQRINEKLDKSWNKKNIQAVMLQGILQGESIPHLAKRLSKTVVQKDKNAAIRNARTMTTAVQNSAKYDAMERAASLGVNIRTQWKAVLDDRTRDRHRELDGMTVDLGEEFPNGLRYPVDLVRHMTEISALSAEGKAICAETYNCRCNIKPLIEGLQPRAEKYRSTEAIGIPYEEWKKGHKAANEWRDEHGLLKHDRKGNMILPKSKIERGKNGRR